LKFLIDNALSPKIADALNQTGHDAVHVMQFKMQAAADRQILRKAREEHRVIVTSDTDFGELLSAEGASEPSVILFRRTSGRSLQEAKLLLLTLEFPEVRDALNKGAIIVIDPRRVRIRNLPIGADLE
jgi:predicted nuclease of predicted toxin-antitoxin system